MHIMDSEKKGPTIDYVHAAGSEICLIGFQSDFEHLSNKKGRIFSDQMETFKGRASSDYVGPFLIGTISPSSCDDGAGICSADGLIGLNLETGGQIQIERKEARFHHHVERNWKKRLEDLLLYKWRTIAPIVGRTAAQRLERYEYLLGEAQRRAEGIEGEDSLKEAKKLKLGDVDPTTETKPASPDPIARLEDLLLYKNTELRAAGIIIGSGWAYKMKKHRLMDYNNEIPFEKQVPAGFHDPSEDKFDKAQKTMVEEKRRDWQERDDRKADKDKLKKRKNEDLPESIFGEKHEKKRSKLILPEPQISDKELEDIIKIGHVSDSVRELVDDNP
uniref:Myb-like domain-containing protein n=1 Tax=Meloidogyne floridensis TaxID=298350 RepID=A0A915NGG4_9BILA